MIEENWKTSNRCFIPHLSFRDFTVLTEDWSPHFLTPSISLRTVALFGVFFDVTYPHLIKIYAFIRSNYCTKCVIQVREIVNIRSHTHRISVRFRRNSWVLSVNREEDRVASLRLICRQYKFRDRLDSLTQKNVAAGSGIIKSSIEWRERVMAYFILVKGNT